MCIRDRWYLCNGSNGTPNLSGKFVVGYSASDGDFDVNDTGGSKDAVLVSHTHNLQNHVHGVNLTTGNQSASHNHSFSGSGSSSHTHGIPRGSGGSQASIQNYVPSPRVESVQSPFNTNSATVSISISGNTGNNSGSHNHTVSGNTGASVPNTTDTLGESATNKNLPPYYALCYIMKS